jgi:hypothetical protein
MLFQSINGMTEEIQIWSYFNIEFKYIKLNNREIALFESEVQYQ